ncbi:EF-hand domain-containing protein [Pleionea sp. CnH1-48]|uniref:EF-hand domain-containing protein n=1 Tax=Pleionea sp. CnH1-48 TaxID=2954494 RepID=UPI00209681BB|nr:EF-hand domain-containing protein [Pleionea sp. CnH1-48]MCO7224226.1 EF-hand domain-containing protein [Pleionea sp. CnH1-48]
MVATEEEKSLFNLFAQEGNQQIAIEDIEKAFAKFSIELELFSLATIAKRLDLTPSSHYELDSFAALLREAKSLNADYEVIKSTFANYDTDDDGFISRSELEKGLAEQESQLPKRELRDLFANMDFNHDGQVSLKEFARFMTFSY